VDGANRHDKMLVKKTLDNIIFERLSPDDVIQNICMDKGYDFPDIRKLVEDFGFTAHIRSRGEEKKYQVLRQEGGLWKGHIRG
jgi:putative transposase